MLTGYFIVVFNDVILPARFFNDADFIQRIAQGQAHAPVWGSFWLTGNIYRILGMADNPLLAGVLGYTAFLLLLTIPTRTAWRRGSPVVAGLVLAATVLLGSVYLGIYSKDAFVLPIIAIVMGASRGWRRELVILGVIILYAMVFRQYWFLVGALYLILRILRYPKQKMFLNLVIVTAGLVAISLALIIFLQQDPDHFRRIVNEGRLGNQDASTLIRPFVTGMEPLGGVINVLLTFLTIQIPFPLVALGGFYYLALAAAIFSLWAIFYASVRRQTARGIGHEPILYQRGVALITGFVMVQSLFEPDYGSALRHLTPLLPLIAFVITLGLGGQEDKGEVPTQTRLSRRGS